MSRITKGYKWRFKKLLEAFGARDPEKGIAQLFHEVNRQMQNEGISLHQALAKTNWELVQRLARWRSSRKARAAVGRKSLVPGVENGPLLFCDAGLGALARWLRACGQLALWNPEFDDDQMLQFVRRTNAILITSDSLLTERRVVTSGAVKLIWLPPDMPVIEQLFCVMVELDLEVRPARCMQCGGELVAVNKETVKDRIPPKTYRWRDEYFLCSACNKLYWEGSHWERISQRLRAAGFEPTLLSDKF